LDTARFIEHPVRTPGGTDAVMLQRRGNAMDSNLHFQCPHRHCRTSQAMAALSNAICRQ
jgi:hypothetical protein